MQLAERNSRGIAGKQRRKGQQPRPAPLPRRTIAPEAERPGRCPRQKKFRRQRDGCRDWIRSWRSPPSSTAVFTMPAAAPVSSSAID
jgi:hypothetical protein